MLGLVDVAPRPPRGLAIFSENPLPIVVGIAAMALGVWALVLASRGTRAGVYAGIGATVAGVLTVVASLTSRGPWGIIVGISFGIMPFSTGIAAAVLARRRSRT